MRRSRDRSSVTRAPTPSRPLDVPTGYVHYEDVFRRDDTLNGVFLNHSRDLAC